MKTVTTKQAKELLAERGITVSYPTIAQWVREGRFAGAERDETERGPVWRIPVASVKKFDPPKTGRPAANAKKGGKR
jgi:transposase-like protein